MKCVKAQIWQHKLDSVLMNKVKNEIIFRILNVANRKYYRVKSDIDNELWAKMK